MQKHPRLLVRPSLPVELLITGESSLHYEIIESALDCAESGIRGDVCGEEVCRYLAELFEAWGEFDAWSRRVWFLAESGDLRGCRAALRERL